MRTCAYHRMAVNELEHWYYLARAQAIDTLLRRYVLPETGRPEILDVGCGTGGTSARLASVGNVLGIEPSETAIELLRIRYPSLDVLQGTLDDLDSLVPANHFDLATVLGVLCHEQVRDPAVALRNIAATLNHRGWILWGDCVYPCLARQHDEVVQAARRFYPRQMHRMLKDAGFEIVFSSHFLGWGFPVGLGLAGFHRIANGLGHRAKDGEHEAVEDRPLSPVINQFLKWLTYWEWRVGLWGLKTPCGVSRLILARKMINGRKTSANSVDWQQGGFAIRPTEENSGSAMDATEAVVH